MPFPHSVEQQRLTTRPPLHGCVPWILASGIVPEQPVLWIQPSVRIARTIDKGAIPEYHRAASDQTRSKVVAVIEVTAEAAGDKSHFSFEGVAEPPKLQNPILQ